MTSQIQILLRLLALAAVTAPAAGVDLTKTLLTERGKLLFSEDFDKPVEATRNSALSLEKKCWRFAVGKWEVVEGALHGSSIKEERHSAVANHPLAFKDAVIQVDVRVDGCRLLQLFLNDPSSLRAATPTRPAHETPEHLCRVVIKPDGFAAQKDDHDHDGPDVAVPFGEVKMAFPPSEWKTVLLEIRGEELVATVDGRSIAGAHPLIATEKAFVCFGVTGESAGFRRLRVWEALPNKDWAANKLKLTPTK